MNDKSAKGFYILFLVGLAALWATRSVVMAVIFGCLAVVFFTAK